MKDYTDSDYITSLDSLAGFVNIAPNKKFLNTCNLVSDNNYLVGGSVFYLFDLAGSGIELSKMNSLFSDTGRQSARAQCAKYVVENIGNDLYLTTDHPGGTSGNSDATGCTSALDPATFLAYCDYVFYQNNMPG